MPTEFKLPAVVFVSMALCASACTSASHDTATSRSAAPAATQPTPSGAAHEVKVIGLDYAFSMPDSVDAGRTAFRFTNNGKVDHEFNVVLLRKGVTLRQYIDAINKGESENLLREAPLGVLFAAPGHTSASVLSADMLPGRTYAIQCSNQDSTHAPTHRTLGMFKSFTVRNSPMPVIAAIATDTIVGTDYAYTQHPHTLTPGWHHFAFSNIGQHDHEINLAMLKTGITMTQVMDSVARHGDLLALVEEPLGVLYAASGASPVATLDFEVLPKREYVAICTFADTPKSPPHFALGMIASMIASEAPKQ